MSPSSTAFAFSSRSGGGHLGDFDLNGVDGALPYESASTYVGAHSSSAIPNKCTPESSGSHSRGSSSTKSRNNKRLEPSPELLQEGNGVVTTVNEEMECDDEEFSQTYNNPVRFDTNNRTNDGGGNTGTPNSDDAEWACPA